MTRRHLRIALCAGLLAYPAITTARPAISTQASPGVNFGSYRTYSWVNTAAPTGVNPVMYQQMMSDFETALEQRGYQKGDPGDLSLILTVGARQKTDVESWGRFGLQTSVNQYTEGQLSFDAFDTKTHKALWHGQATEAVNPEKPNTAAIDAAITKLMQQFPSNSGSNGTAP